MAVPYVQMTPPVPPKRVYAFLPSGEFKHLHLGGA